MENNNYFSLLFIASIVWCLIGFGFSINWYKDIWAFTQLHTFTQEQRSIATYGTDYLAYSFLAKTPPTSKIIYMVPDAYYFPKAIYFLYPRHIKPITQPKELQNLNLADYDYLLTYISIPSNIGSIQGLNLIQASTWHEQEIYDLDKLLAKDNQPLNPDTFKQKVLKNRGILLYKLK